MIEPNWHTVGRMSQESSGTNDLPTPKTAGNVPLSPRPAEGLDAAEVRIVSGPEPTPPAGDPGLPA
jgi:hypothetical protein